MRVLRGLLGSLLWILACVVALVGALLSVTIVLAPVGVPLLFLARRLFGASMALFLPRAIRHPAQELGKKGRDAAGDVGKKARKTSKKKNRLWGRKRSWFERLVDGVLQAL
jgi:hypothetical protein